MHISCLSTSAIFILPHQTNEAVHVFYTVFLLFSFTLTLLCFERKHSSFLAYFICSHGNCLFKVFIINTLSHRMKHPDMYLLFILFSFVNGFGFHYSHLSGSGEGVKEKLVPLIQGPSDTKELHTSRWLNEIRKPESLLAPDLLAFSVLVPQQEDNCRNSGRRVFFFFFFSSLFFPARFNSVFLELTFQSWLCCLEL